MQTSKKSTAKQPSPKLLLITGGLVVLVIVIIWAFYALNKPTANQANKTTSTTSQNATVLTINTSLQQNGATQVCSAGNTGPGNLTSSSTNIVYEISKSRSDTATLIKKVAADNGYGTLTHTTNGSADFYEANNKDTAATISFTVYSDRKYTSCDPTPSTDPSQTAFVLSMTYAK